jgi:hypothetical protein
VIAQISDRIWEDRYAKDLADLTAFRESLPEDWRRLVVGPIEGIVNGDQWIVFLPDGSKEGWEPSHRGDKYRAQFVERFGGVLAYWGDDGPGAYYAEDGR